MEEQELRIGNLVEIDGSVLELNRKRFEYAVCKDCCLGIKPIPLTEEWLLNFGFTLDSGVGVWFSNQKHFPIWQAYGSKPYQYTVNNPSDNINITTVHQLQNLYFALTGDELQLI